MRALSASASIQIPHQLSSPLRKQAFPITTTTRKEQTFFPQQPLSLQVLKSADESRVVPLAATDAAVSKFRTDDKEEEVKSLLTLFLNNLSLKDTIEFCKSVHFIDNLVSKLYNIHIVEFPIGRELTHVEIRNALIPSIESLAEENRDILIKRKKLPIPHQTINNTSLDSIKPNANYRVSSSSSSSNIQQHVGAFDRDSWKENEPLIEFILKLGVLESNIPMIIQTCPELLKTRIHDVKSTIDYLYEMGLSKEDICKIINNYPNILRLNIDDKLRRTAEYFRSKGIDPCVLLRQQPRIWDPSLEHDLKPVTEFFLERGFCVDDFVNIALKFPRIFTVHVSKQLIPKWDFFLTLDYPRLEVIMFPNYFGFSLEARIKPRFAQLREKGLELSLSAVLLPSDDDFEKIVNGEVKKTRYYRGSLSIKSNAGLRS